MAANHPTASTRARARVVKVVTGAVVLEADESRGERDGVRLQVGGYFTPMTIESGPIRCSAWVVVNPASVIQPMQSAAV